MIDWTAIVQIGCAVAQAGISWLLWRRWQASERALDDARREVRAQRAWRKITQFAPQFHAPLASAATPVPGQRR